MDGANKSGLHPRTSRWTTRWIDRAAGWLISVGGIGTIIAVSMVGLSLLWVVLPLLRAAKFGSPAQSPAVWTETPSLMGLNEHRTLGWYITSDGSQEAFRPHGRDLVTSAVLAPDLNVTAAATDGGNQAWLGLADGSVRRVSLRMQTDFVELNQLPADVPPLENGQTQVWQGAILQRTSPGLIRREQMTAEVGARLPIVEVPIRQIDYLVVGTDTIVLVLTDAGECHYGKLRGRRDLLTGEVRETAQWKQVPIPESMQSPQYVRLAARGNQVYVLDQSGRLARIDASKATAEIVEMISILQDADTRVTCLTMLPGRETMIVADSQGDLYAWSRVRATAAETSDGAWLVPIHRLASGQAPVTCLGTSTRSRLLAAGDQAGHVRIYQCTNGQLITAIDTGIGSLSGVEIAPRDDGVIAYNDHRFWDATLDPGHPEANLQALFAPVWYEGTSHPDLTWQSSFAGVESEMKLSLRPLIFGTLKATVYSMLFGAPLAMLAALYTSEFVSWRWRARIKSAIEMMASLPSVVLGFLAAMMIAPWVERHLTACLAGLITVPFFVLLRGYLWQLLPPSRALAWPRLSMISVVGALAVAAMIAPRVGLLMEHFLFADDIRLWLDRQRGTGVGAWWLLGLPLCAIGVSLLVTTRLNPWLRYVGRQWTWLRFASVRLATFLVASCLVLISSLAIAMVLAGAGWDPRGSYIGTYVQRNALIVGSVMGFAIIPIIYTLAEDALGSVPQHLRFASLGAGATTWQTAVRVVIPTAMSGLFSALMVGLGRAVGETMIVLMAAGNTPIREWNIFNGFRTLSATIAVELPEAVRDSTHYRTLFLAALVLFILTFAVNTLAESVRLHFRSRAARL